MSALITEKEAATKWCPFTRVGIYAGPALTAVNRHPSDDTDRPDIQSETRCLASGCMAWRWVDPLPEKPEAMWRSWPGIWDAPDGAEFATILKRSPPPRPDDVPASWIEIPLTGQDWEDADGGYWEEPPAEAEIRWRIECDQRKGGCGLADGGRS